MLGWLYNHTEQHTFAEAKFKSSAAATLAKPQYQLQFVVNHYWSVCCTLFSQLIRPQKKRDLLLRLFLSHMDEWRSTWPDYLGSWSWLLQATTIQRKPKWPSTRWQKPLIFLWSGLRTKPPKLCAILSCQTYDVCTQASLEIDMERQKKNLKTQQGIKPTNFTTPMWLLYQLSYQARWWRVRYLYVQVLLVLIIIIHYITKGHPN